jgi:anti-anti-sigma factor
MVPGRLDVDLVRAGSLATLAARGDLDMATAPTLVEAAERVLGDQPAGELIVDLAGVGFCDSAGINALIHLRKRADQAGWLIRVARPQAPVRRVLELTGLQRHLNLT